MSINAIKMYIALVKVIHVIYIRLALFFGSFLVLTKHHAAPLLQDCLNQKGALKIITLRIYEFIFFNMLRTPGISYFVTNSY